MPRTDGQDLRAWRRSLGWDVPELARRMRQAARGAPVPTHDSLVRMIRGWEADRHRMSERYELLCREVGFRPQHVAGQRAGSAVAPAAAADLTDETEDNGEVQRREFLSASAGLAGLLTVPPQLAHLAAGRRIGTAMPGLLRRRLARL